MPFPTHVIVTLEKEGTFSCPPEEFREKMLAALKDYFREKLEEEPWSDIEATLWFEVQRTPLFKEKRMMVKIKNISVQLLITGPFIIGNTAAADSAAVSILSNFKCFLQPPRLGGSASPSGYALSRYPPVAYWGEAFFSSQSVL